MSTPIAEYIFPTLERIAQSYPRALYYPFQMSCEFYELRKDKLSAESRRSIEKIMHLIRSPIMEKFSDELRRLSNPEHIVKDFLDYIKVMLSY
jgi:DNA-dependent protein kinase catalytic subunit